ncbi:hypothetical protein K456DRAFT_1724289 [Colletotrichum gloeosporioides 23]|nr:hypothetical protein K456DRAFT_1724289 [Colletotrichum gloeosporioides 23]
MPPKSPPKSPKTADSEDPDQVMSTRKFGVFPVFESEELCKRWSRMCRATRDFGRWMNCSWMELSTKNGQTIGSRFCEDESVGIFFGVKIQQDQAPEWFCHLMPTKHGIDATSEKRRHERLQRKILRQNYIVENLDTFEGDFTAEFVGENLKLPPHLRKEEVRLLWISNTADSDVSSSSSSYMGLQSDPEPIDRGFTTKRAKYHQSANENAKSADLDDPWSVWTTPKERKPT